MPIIAGLVTISLKNSFLALCLTTGQGLYILRSKSKGVLSRWSRLLTLHPNDPVNQLQRSQDLTSPWQQTSLKDLHGLKVAKMFGISNTCSAYFDLESLCLTPQYQNPRITNASRLQWILHPSSARLVAESKRITWHRATSKLYLLCTCFNFNTSTWHLVLSIRCLCSFCYFKAVSLSVLNTFVERQGTSSTWDPTQIAALEKVAWAQTRRLSILTHSLTGKAQLKYSHPLQNL